MIGKLRPWLGLGLIVVSFVCSGWLEFGNLHTTDGMPAGRSATGWAVVVAGAGFIAGLLVILWPSRHASDPKPGNG